MAVQRLLNAEQGERICQQLARMSGNSYTIDSTETSSKLMSQAQGEKIIELLSDNPTADTSWGGASDEMIVSLVQKADAGEIDLYNDLGWRVGDIRQVTLTAGSLGDVAASNYPGQTINMVLLDTNHYDLSTAVPSGSKCHFVVGITNPTIGYMASSSQARCVQLNMFSNNQGSVDSAYSWRDTQLRTFLNNSFRNSITGIKTIFKQFKVHTGYSDSNTIVTTDDYFTIPSVKEVYGANVRYTSAVKEISVSSSATSQYFGSQTGLGISQAEYESTNQLQYFQNMQYTYSQGTNDTGTSISVAPNNVSGAATTQSTSVHLYRSVPPLKNTISGVVLRYIIIGSGSVYATGTVQSPDAALAIFGVI